MFKISPINDKKTQAEFAFACGCEYADGYFGYGMSDNETSEIMAFSQFEIDENGGYIKDLRSRKGLSDFEAMFILGRATMNFIDLCGAHICRTDANAADERLLTAIGFKKDSGDTYICDMTGMFDGHCDGEKSK